MARFRVSGSFPLESRKPLVLAGDVVDGRIVPGMEVQIPFNTEAAMTAPIYAVEYILHSGGREEVGLCIKYQDAEELELWKGLNIASEIIEVSSRDA